MPHYQGGKAHSITFPYKKHFFPHKVAAARYFIEVLLLYSQHEHQPPQATGGCNGRTEESFRKSVCLHQCYGISLVSLS